MIRGTGEDAPMPTFHCCDPDSAVGCPQQQAAVSRRSVILTEAVTARQVFSVSQP